MSHVDGDTLALLALEPATAGDEERRHLETCARCRQAVEQLGGTAALARSLTPGERESPLPPPRVWDAIVTELAASGDLPASPPPEAVEDEEGTSAEARSLQAEGPRGPWPWLALAAAAAVLALVAGGVLFRGRDPAPTVLADATLEALTEGEPGTAHLLQDPDGLHLVVETAGLPEPDGYYALWLTDREVTQVFSLGPLDDGRRYLLPQGLDVASFPVVDVSLEPLDGDPGHSGNSVLRGVLPLDVRPEGGAAGR